MLTVQYPDTQVQSMNDLKQIPLRSVSGVDITTLGGVTDIKAIESPTELIITNCSASSTSMSRLPAKTSVRWLHAWTASSSAPPCPKGCV